MTFFESLVKPDWIPPDWAFPVAWFSLWALQLVAALSLAFEPSTQLKRVALTLLISQFIAAVVWQAFVFAPGRLTFAAWWLAAVLALVIAATTAAWLIDWKAGALIAPTIVWMSVATTLGFTLARLNPGV